MQIEKEDKSQRKKGGKSFFCKLIYYNNIENNIEEVMCMYEYNLMQN